MSPERITRVLGLDIGNAKVKALYLEVQQGQIRRCVWDSLPLPVSEDRAMDFQVYLPLELLQFFHAQGLDKTELDQVVVCCSHSFAFDPYSDSIRHLQGLLQDYFEAIPVALVRADGQLTPLEELTGCSDAALYAYVFTNFYGSAWLASQQIEQGISLDMGTTTLDIIPIHGGQIDPRGLAAPARARDYLRFRYHQDRIHWLGMTVTPLEKLTARVALNGESYQVVPRGYRSENLFALPSPTQTVKAELLTRHAYGKHLPNIAQAQRALAESIGLDRSLLTPTEILQVRQAYIDALIDQVSEAIERVVSSEFKTQPREALQVAAFALGAEDILKPALERCGFRPQQWIDLKYGQEDALWSATSVFAMALLALKQQGQNLVLS